MAGKAINPSSKGFLVALLPIAFVLTFLFVAWPIVLSLIIAGLFWRLWQQYQWQKWSEQVNPYFHQILQITQGRVTALDLAMKLNLSGAAAEEYLATKAREFGAQRRDYEDGTSVYYFITASTLGSIFDDSELELPTEQSSVATLAPGSELEAEIEEDSPEPTADQRAAKAMIQSELARRFNVHSSTIFKRRSEPSFTDWSRNCDPEGIAWKFVPESKLFFPLDSKLTSF